MVGGQEEGRGALRMLDREGRRLVAFEEPWVRLIHFGSLILAVSPAGSLIAKRDAGYCNTLPTGVAVVAKTAGSLRNFWG